MKKSECSRGRWNDRSTEPTVTMDRFGTRFDGADVVTTFKSKRVMAGRDVVYTASTRSDDSKQNGFPAGRGH